MSGSEYWLRQQISLAQWRDFYRAAEHERQVEIALEGQAQRIRLSEVRHACGRLFLKLAFWLLVDEATQAIGQERSLLLECRPGQ
jgi:hypothetical protein